MSKSKRLKNKIFPIIVLIFALPAFILYQCQHKAKEEKVIGQVVDTFNGVNVYYNGDIDHVAERNLTADNYNLGLKYQCVEFVKRYYYEYFNHKMPDTYGHAKDFYNPWLADGELNKQRNLTQHTNPSKTKPRVSDLVILDKTVTNAFGHVAIISNVSETEIEIIQQNPGPNGSSRVTMALELKDNKWKIDNSRIRGWLSKED